MKKSILVATFSIVFVGCSTTSPTPSVINAEIKVAGVKPATEERVKSCEYLDDITGTSGWYGMFATKGIENAKAEAIKKAGEIGASHIVWQSNQLIYGSTSVTGKVYRCTN